MNLLYYVIWKSATLSEWFTEGPMEGQAALDYIADNRETVTEAIILFRHIDNTMSVLSEDDVFEDNE